MVCPVRVSPGVELVLSALGIKIGRTVDNPGEVASVQVPSQLSMM